MHYVFTNPEKERLAREAIKFKGQPKGRQGDDPALVAEYALYHRALGENPKMTKEELFTYIYKGLAGRVEEYATEAEAAKRVEHLLKLRKQANPAF